MTLLKTRQYIPTLNQQQKDRAYRRALKYRWMGRYVYKIPHTRHLKIVPPPPKRLPLINTMHTRYGHVGVKRVFHALQQDYWWHGMGDQVIQCIKDCVNCSRSKGTFAEERTQLQPLPIRGLFYRWGVDFAGPLPTSTNSNIYVMICVE